jgi:exosortase
VPPPTWVIDLLTLPLKQFVTYVSTEGLHLAGVPIAREGVTIFVGQYELLVEDACSGMHSILGLVAITLLYVYLMRGASWRLSLLYTTIAIPIAVVANILRIVVLVLLTYNFGNAVAQGFLHQTAGILLFGTALLLVFGVDQGLTSLMRRARTPA